MTAPTRPLEGDFGLVATYGSWVDRLAAWTIRWGTDSPVNHAFIYIGEGQIVEAAPGGARQVPLSKYRASSIIWSTGRLPLTATKRQVICGAAGAYAEAHIGYGYLDLLAIGLAQHRAFGVVHADWPLAEQPWWVRRIESMHTLICSQLVDACYEHAGVHLFGDGRIPGLVSPGDLWRRIGSPALVAA